MVEVLKTGFYDTIQDLGRIGFQDYGVPYSGVMDAYSAQQANLLLGNHLNAAVIESVMYGPQLKFSTTTCICITGADMNASLNGIAIKNNSVISVGQGDHLTFGKINYGFRTYIAILGGFKTEMLMNSRSMYSGITVTARLSKGDVLPIQKDRFIIDKSFTSLRTNRTHFDSTELQVFKGPEYDQLNSNQKDILFKQKFTINKDSNRMAYQFDERIENSLKDIITSLVLPGTVQLTPSGQLLVLMRDCQTTGGYPRILQLSEASVNRLSQKIFGSKIRLTCIK